MRTISKSTLTRFSAGHADAAGALNEWYKQVDRAQWTCFADLRNDFPSADSIANDRIVFNVKGNRYRIVAVIDFPMHGVLVRFVGTHAEYDKINAETL